MIDTIVLRDKSKVKRSIIKTLTWRLIGTIDTVCLAWWISGDPMTGLQVGGAEVFTKMILYFVHERLWNRIRVGKKV